MVRTYEIYPSIGVARLGRSADYFFGPEPDGTFPPPVTMTPDGQPRSMRDANGNLRPQATRFRVFEVERQNAQITIAREVQAAEADVTWQVHVVNRKAAAPRFAVSGHRNHNPAVRRNGAKNTDDLSDPANLPLIINPGKQTIGTAAGSPSSAVLAGAFKGQSVQLGRISVEVPTGRLIFVAGLGISDTVPSGGSLSPVSGDFADNDGWFDDTCDGTVEATLKFKADNRIETARAAWVVSGAYDFAPEVTNLVTIYDVLFEMAVDKGLRSLPSTVYYDQHILPLFERVSGYQWVNRRARNFHGTGQPDDFVSNPLWSTLGNPAVGSAQRQAIFSHLREPGSANAPDSIQMPLLFSDDFPDDTSVLWLTKVQFTLLKKWASDNFQPTAPSPTAELLPDALTRMQLESCVGRAFWPGIEISIRIYDPTIFFSDDPFRIAVPGILQPGMLTQSMSVPWQSDFLDCATETNAAGMQLYWWPAQRPNEVLPRGAGGAVMRAWASGISGGLDMVKRWHLLGIVRQTGPGNAQHEIERAL